MSWCFSQLGQIVLACWEFRQDLTQKTIITSIEIILIAIFPKGCDVNTDITYKLGRNIVLLTQ